MPVTASLFGLGVRANRPLAGLAGLPPADRIDVEVVMGELPPGCGTRAEAQARLPYVSTLHTDGRLELFVTRLPDGRGLRFDYDDNTVVIVETEGRRVWAAWPEPLTADDVAVYVLGPVMGVLLRLRGIVCLHASAVEMGEGAIALVGASGAGKSTTAAAFSRLGFNLLADDLVPVIDGDDGFEIVASRPRIRLWPDSAEALFGSYEALPRVKPDGDKRQVDLARPGAAPLRAQLSALYFLDKQRRSAPAPLIDDMPPRDAAMALITDSFATRYQDRDRRAREFDLTAQMVRRLPMRRVHAPADLQRLGELCEAIRADHDRVTRAVHA